MCRHIVRSSTYVEVFAMNEELVLSCQEYCGELPPLTMVEVRSTGVPVVTVVGPLIVIAGVTEVTVMVIVLLVAVAELGQSALLVIITLTCAPFVKLFEL